MATQRVILQVPLTNALRTSAESAAMEQGFSSIQEAIRVFLTKLSQKQIVIGFHEPVEHIKLSPRAQTRYTHISDDIKKRNAVTKTQSLNELFHSLDS